MDLTDALEKYPALLDPAQLREALNLDPKSYENLSARGMLPTHVQFSARIRRFPKSEIVAWAQRRAGTRVSPVVSTDEERLAEFQLMVADANGELVENAEDAR